LSWKNMDAHFLIQGAAQRKIFLTGGARTMYANGSYNNYSYLADSWTPQNTDAKYPLAWVSSNSIDNRNSDFWLRNGDYVRLKSVDLGYKISPGWLAKSKISQLRLFVSALNLFTISGVEEFDPEMETGGGWYYPQQKSYNLGINLSF
jgi:hypothetical protein